MTTVDTEAQAAWDALSEEQRQKLLAGEGDWGMDDLFEYEESCSADGEESCWFMLTDLGRRTQAYGEGVRK